MAHDRTAFSRSMTSPMGKLLWELKTKVDEDTADRFKAITEKAGTDVAGALRDYVFKVVHGESETDMAIREANARRERMLSTPIGEALKESSI